MELQHINVKIFVDGELTVDLQRFIEIFHRWVSQQSMDELLIDVADYRHVPAGPGVVLVGLQADYAIDHGHNRWGLLYNRKAEMDGSNKDRCRQALGAAANACLLLESELEGEGPLRFSRQEFSLLVNDRAIAPNTVETRQAYQPAIEEFLRDVVDHDDFIIEYEGDPRRRFGVTVKTSKPLDWAAILAAAR